MEVQTDAAEIASEKPDDSSEKSTMGKPYAKAPSPKSDTARPSSPPPNCAICLGHCRNKSFTDSCLHQFCFKCLVTWSKVKAECPLCKQPFKSIIHNIKSNEHYDEYVVETNPPEQEPEQDVFDMSYFDGPRFRYRTTLTLHRREGRALQRLLLGLPTSPPRHFAPTTRRGRRRPNAVSFRESVYRHNLWASPLPDVTGRFRECTSEFYSENPAQIHRLLQWLQRELSVLADSDFDLLIDTILTLLPRHSIQSSRFRRILRPVIGQYTDHFLHEFYIFASTPYDLVGYDRSVVYLPRSITHPPTYINEILSSDNDSDIVLSSPEREPPAEEFPASTSNGLNSLSNSVIAIETMSHSETEDSSDEVVMVGYIKPPHERTPEVVNLDSDSDTMIIEEERRVSSPIEVEDDASVVEPSTSFNYNLDAPSTSGLVKVKLKHSDKEHFQTTSTDTDANDPDYDPEEDAPPVRQKSTKRKHKKSRLSSRNSASTEDTDRDTDSEYALLSNLSCHSDESDDCDSDYSDSKAKRLCKRKQTLASRILKRFKMSAPPEQEQEVTTAPPPSSSLQTKMPSTSGNSTTQNKQTNEKKSKAKIIPQKSPVSQAASNSDSKKLKIKGRSKSKEKLINKIYENRQVNDSTSKSVDSSKAKAKNKLFIKKSKHSEASTSSSSSTNSNQSSNNVSDSENMTTSPEASDNLLDIVTKSILKPNNSLLSINEHSQNATSHNHQVPSSVKHLLNEINDSVFCQNSSPHFSNKDQSSE